MCLERALGGDERSVAGSAGPDQTLGREIGLWCCAEAAEPCSGSLVLCGCSAELVCTADTVLGLSSRWLRPCLGYPWNVFLGKQALLLHHQLGAIWAF